MYKYHAHNTSKDPLPFVSFVNNNSAAMPQRPLYLPRGVFMPPVLGGDFCGCELLLLFPSERFNCM